MGTRLLGFAAVALALASLACAQRPSAITPRTWELRRAEHALPEPPELRLPLADPFVFLEQNRERMGAHTRAVRGLAPQGFEAFDLDEKAAWEELPGGGVALRLTIRSPDAGSHIVVFSDVWLPENGRLSIYAPAATRNLTRCAHSCVSITSADVAEGVLTTPMIEGEEIALEYSQPAMPVPGESDTEPILRVASIMQGLPDTLHRLEAKRRRRLLSIDGPGRRLQQNKGQPGPAKVPTGLATGPSAQPGGPSTPAPVPWPPYVPGTSFRVDLLQQRSDKLGSCTPSVECDPQYSQVAKAVIDIYAINLSLGAMALCTGTIISAPMNRKYVLTADHCFVDKTQINNFRYWLMIFNYEAPCGATVSPPITNVIQGMTLKFYDSHADVLLLSVPNIIPDHYNVYELGYDASDNAVPKSGFAIHHPAGNIARISSFNQTAGSISTDFMAAKFPPGQIQPSDTTHFEVKWGLGATEGGSSGSPLIDADTGRVMGVLTGGFSSCDQPHAPDYYGRLSKAWTGGLDHYLSTDPPEQLVIEVADTLAQSMDGKVVVQSLNGTTPYQHGPGLAFYPAVITMSPNHLNATFSYFLTDPLKAGETIYMNMTVNGLVPGNTWDVTPKLMFSATNDSFVEGTERRRNITVTMTNINPNEFKPGDLVRFLLIFELISDQDPNYKHIHTLKGIGQRQLGPWTQYQPVMCVPATERHPCSFNEDIIRQVNVTQPNATGLAIFQRTATSLGHHCIDTCLMPGVLKTSTISIYINKMFTWTLAADPFGDPNCVHIPGLTVEANHTYTLVVSDKDDLDAVLPVGVVRSVVATPLTAESDELQLLDTQRIQLGPVAGPASGASVTKSLNFGLPPGSSADVDRARQPAAAAGAPAGMLASNPGLPAGAGAPSPAFAEDAGKAFSSKYEWGSSFGL
ncbi:hypothetical protein WJX81_005312 [Elliptochloris bilobata]|uniref:Peptidase S1 domain-containing protein n=1 Tax=Elliptochloris bilobata TaxID=381761 RepID=A0AAW1RR46_9CHLO